MKGRTRGLAAGTALLLAVVSCTQSTDPITTGSSLAGTTSTTPRTTTTQDPLLAAALPVDPEVIEGTLDNGLAYYIRENDSPGGRAELRLLVDAGSVQEDPDQAGTAHFLEHMMFNGTENYARNELVDVLEAFGPRFGPDINAFTSYDETVYELSLTTDDDLLGLGIEVLREWATRASLTETDVVEERGVVLDEWRTRAQGFEARINEQIESLILPGSAYEGHSPIGTADAIVTTSPTVLERFYDDWYQPDRMAVVAVGDFDADDIEQRIVAAFDDIPPSETPRSWEIPGFGPPVEPRVSSYADEEAALAGVTVLWPVSSREVKTVGDYQSAIAGSLGLQILADRLSDDGSAGTGGLLGAAAVDTGWTRALAIRGVDVELRASRLKEGLIHVLQEIERVRRDGIATEEFQRSISGYASISRQLYEQRESVQDSQVTDQILRHHLTGAHLMSPEQRFDVESKMLDRLTKSDVDEALAAIISRPPAVLALGPDDVGVDLPDPSAILSVLDGLATADLGPRDGVGTSGSELMTRPEPAPILSTTVDSRFEFTTLEFENGADVYLWESDIATGAVYGMIEGFGGSSRSDLDDLPEAFLMTEIVGRSGVAGFDVPALRRLLAGRIVSVSPWITETRQGLEANSSKEDVEIMLQLLHLTMTQPRLDPTAVDAVLDEMTTLNASRSDLPDLLFEEAVSRSYYGDDPRYFVLPDESDLASFDLADARRVFGERFGNAGAFAFAFVGDFETETMVDLAARYIGTLPGTAEAGGFIDHQPLPPREVQITTVEAGSGDQGQLGLFFTNEFEPDLRGRLTARLVELIASARLRDRIREELSATYSIQASIDLQRDPDAFSEAFVISSGDPAGLDQISDEVLADLASLQSEGPTDAEFATAVEQLRDELELLNNRTLATHLITAHLYPDQPVSDVADRYVLVDGLTPGDVRDLAALVFDLSQRIEVRQVPRG